MLVIGGTVNENGSDYLKEDACELEPCMHPDIYKSFKESILSEDADVIYSELEFLSGLDVNIVGSRGRVYHAGYLASLLKNIMDGKPKGQPFPFHLFPRTMGLRNAISKGMVKRNG